MHADYIYVCMYVRESLSITSCNFNYLQGISTLHNDCTNGSVRLVGRDINDEGVREGRVEVCVNRAWGTVCDERFTQGDAQGDAEVVCGQLGGFSREGIQLLCFARLHGYY